MAGTDFHVIDPFRRHPELFRTVADLVLQQQLSGGVEYAYGLAFRPFDVDAHVVAVDRHAVRQPLGDAVPAYKDGGERHIGGHGDLPRIGLVVVAPLLEAVALFRGGGQGGDAAVGIESVTGDLAQVGVVGEQDDLVRVDAEDGGEGGVLLRVM